MPAFVGVAINVVGVPLQILVVAVVIATLAVTTGFTVAIKLFDKLVAFETQAAFESIEQVTKSLFAKVVVLNVAPVCPATVVPFIFQV